jgi:hypothetical protein
VTRQLDLAICAMLARAAETEEGAALSAEATHS